MATVRLARLANPVTAIGLLAAVLLTACGSGTEPGSASSQPESTGPADCPVSALQITLDTAAAGVAAGSSLVPLQFRNVSASRCALSAFPDVWLAAGAAGPQLGPQATEQGGARPAVELAPGGVAHAWLQIQDAANYPASICKPVTARGLRVSFGAGSAYLARDIPACVQGTPHGSMVAVFAVQPGRAQRGTAP